MKGHTGAVRSVGFSKDSRHLVTAGDDKLVKVRLLYLYLVKIKFTIPIFLFPRFGPYHLVVSSVPWWDIVTGFGRQTSTPTLTWSHLVGMTSW